MLTVPSGAVIIAIKAWNLSWGGGGGLSDRVIVAVVPMGTGLGSTFSVAEVIMSTCDEVGVWVGVKVRWVFGVEVDEGMGV